MSKSVWLIEWKTKKENDEKWLIDLSEEPFESAGPAYDEVKKLNKATLHLEYRAIEYRRVEKP